VRESAFDRRYDMATLAVDTANAGRIDHRLRIPFLPRDTADALLRRLELDAAGSAFRW